MKAREGQKSPILGAGHYCGFSHWLVIVARIGATLYDAIELDKRLRALDCEYTSRVVELFAK